MCQLPRLQTLNISGNVQLNLLEIRPVFQNLTELRSLSMADITNMPLGIFVPLSNLLMLNISGTHLNNETLQILNPLAKLKVSHAHDVLRVDLALCFLIFTQRFNLPATTPAHIEIDKQFFIHSHTYLSCALHHSRRVTVAKKHFIHK